MHLRTGYASGVFDLFHIGHLELLKGARAQCDRLVAGIATDAYVLEAKGHLPVVPFQERAAIVEALEIVDEVVPDDSEDKVRAWARHRFDVFFKGDDWKGTAKGARLEGSLCDIGVPVVYLPYTHRTSSTLLRDFLERAPR